MAPALLLSSLLILTASAAAQDREPWERAPGERVPKVLIVGIDGFRADVLWAAETPQLDALMARGCWTDEALAGPVTVSGPGWSNLLTGVWSDKHGSIDNSFENTNYDEYPHMFARLSDARPWLITAQFVDWMPLDRHVLGETECDVRFAHDYRDDGDAVAVDVATRALHHQDIDIAFFYFADLDVAGHDHGFHPTVPAYVAELEEIDGQLGELLWAISTRRNRAYEDWLVIVTTDHGGTLDGGHGRDIPAHRRIPFIVSGPGAARGRWYGTVNQVDVPAIAAAHLGIDVDPAWGWDGRATMLELGATPLATNLLYNGDAERNAGYENGESDAGVAGWADRGSMTVVRYGSPEGFPDAESRGPPERGDNFFCGGADPESEMSQVLDLADLVRRIDGDKLRYTLSAWLGGFGEQRDMAYVTATFLDASGRPLQRARIGPVTLEDRRAAIGGDAGAMTGMLRRETSGPVPAGTRRVRVTVHAEAGTGINDGYADDVSFLLR